MLRIIAFAQGNRSNRKLLAFCVSIEAEVMSAGGGGSGSASAAAKRAAMHAELFLHSSHVRMSDKRRKSEIQEIRKQTPLSFSHRSTEHSGATREVRETHNINHDK